MSFTGPRDALGTVGLKIRRPCRKNADLCFCSKHWECSLCRLKSNYTVNFTRYVCSKHWHHCNTGQTLVEVCCRLCVTLASPGPREMAEASSLKFNLNNF